MNAGITANNIAYVTSDPLYAIVRFFASDQIAPVGVNWGGYKNPKVDALINEAKQTFDPAKQDELIAQAHALIVDDAALVWVVHDTNPHALSPKIKKFVQAQHWFQDLTHDRGGVRRSAMRRVGKAQACPPFDAETMNGGHGCALPTLRLSPAFAGDDSILTSSAAQTRRSSLPAAAFPGSRGCAPHRDCRAYSSEWASSVRRPRSIASSAPSQSRLR